MSELDCFWINNYSNFINPFSYQCKNINLQILFQSFWGNKAGKQTGGERATEKIVNKQARKLEEIETTN